MFRVTVPTTLTRSHDFLNHRTPSETQMSYSQRPNAQILELNGQPLDPYHPPILRRTASGHLFDPTGSIILSQSNVQKPIDAMILDLRGNPIRRGEPHPLLRRTASGYLFLPPPSSVHECELQDARSVTPDTPDFASPMVPDVHQLPATSMARRPGHRRLNTQATLRAAPAKQAQVVEPESGSSSETLGRQRSMIAMVETASSETLHSNVSYHDIFAYADSPQATTGRHNVTPLVEHAPTYVLRHVGSTPDLRGVAAIQGILTNHGNETQKRSMPVMAESQNPTGLHQGLSLATYEEHERYHRGQLEPLRIMRVTVSDPVTPALFLETAEEWRSETATLLEPPSPTSTTVCGAEEEVGAEEKGTRPWSEDVWMQVAKD